MSRAPIQPERLPQAVSLLEEAIHPAAVLLFGSHVKERAGAGSDIDLAVLVAGPRLSWETVSRLRADLEDVLSSPVDLVVLDDASPVLAMQVLREGKMLSCRDREALEAFTVRTLTEYADLKIIRREAERRLMEPRLS